MKYYLGIDIGGTFIKGAFVDEKGNILSSGKIPTDAKIGGEKIIYDISEFAKKLTLDAKIDIKEVVGIGMGVPGLVDDERGVVTYAPKLKWVDFEGAKLLEKLTSLPVRIANDANAAALGETKFGVGKRFKNTVTVTLGTGVGGGVVIDGKLFEGFSGAGAELGHSVIVMGGEPCSCGRRGCLEAYASASAIIRETKRAMKENPKSKLWLLGDLDSVDGKRAFDCYYEDESAKTVVDTFIERLSAGLVNFANIFRPEALIIGGGVSAQGDFLKDRIQKIVDKEVYGSDRGPRVEVLIAELRNSAGSLGAAALFME